MKTWFDPNRDDYHSSPRCPEVKPARRPKLEMFKGGAPEGYYPCETCCPLEIHYCEREAQRPPIVFHLDEHCDALTEELSPERHDGWERGHGQLSGAIWPSKTYEDVVSNPRGVWSRCTKCVPHTDVLHPLESPERPTHVRRRPRAA